MNRTRMLGKAVFLVFKSMLSSILAYLYEGKQVWRWLNKFMWVSGGRAKP